MLYLVMASGEYKWISKVGIKFQYIMEIISGGCSVEISAVSYTLELATPGLMQTLELTKDLLGTRSIPIVQIPVD